MKLNFDTFLQAYLVGVDLFWGCFSDLFIYLF